MTTSGDDSAEGESSGEGGAEHRLRSVQAQAGASQRLGSTNSDSDADSESSADPNEEDAPRATKSNSPRPQRDYAKAVRKNKNFPAKGRFVTAADPRGFQTVHKHRRQQKQDNGANTHNRDQARTHKTDNVVVGSGRFKQLRAAAPIKSTQSGAERDPPGVFVSRLHRDTTSADLGNHIHRCTGLRVKCIPLKSRRDDCGSFRLVAADRLIPRLLDNELWPTRVIARKFQPRSQY